MSERDSMGAHRASTSTEIPCIACKDKSEPDPNCLICHGSGKHYRWDYAKTIHDMWRRAPAIQIDPDCPKLYLEMPLRVGPFASIGFPGFGYDDSGFWGPKEHPFGVVILEGVALHSHVTIDRGSWRDTFIGKNVRLNNYVHVGHNARIGDYVLVGVGAKIAGSVELEDGVTIWNGAEIKQHLKIGEGAVIGMGAVVLEDVPPNTTVVGNPARKLGK